VSTKKLNVINWIKEGVRVCLKNRNTVNVEGVKKHMFLQMNTKMIGVKPHLATKMLLLLLDYIIDRYR
jgi:hypothetical protein